MTRQEATHEAKAFLKRNPLEQEEYVWVVGEPHRVNGGWYFDYQIRHTGSLPREDWESFAGAPGFLVPSDGTTVRTVSWPEQRELFDESPAK